MMSSIFPINSMLYTPPPNPLQQTLYVHRVVQKTLGQKKPSSYVPVADGFVTSSGTVAGQNTPKIDGLKQ